MRIILRVFLISVFLLGSGCAKKPGQADISGKYRGYIREKNKTTLAEIELQSSADNIEGRFTVLGQAGQNIGKGKSFDIVNAQLSGDNLHFIVPVSESDDVSMAFNLTVENGRLRGYANEIRPDSEKIPVIFTKEAETTTPDDSNSQ